MMNIQRAFPKFSLFFGCLWLVSQETLTKTLLSQIIHEVKLDEHDNQKFLESKSAWYSPHNRMVDNMKKAALTLILICLMASVAVCVRPIKAQYQGNITINTDGSITPISVPIVPSGNTYNLTSNIDGSITVKRSNIVLNGNGFSLSNGLLLYEVSNITVNGFVITGNQFGANVGYPADGCAEDGILLSNTSNVMIVNNTIFGIWSPWELNGEAFNGIDVEGGNSNVITGNLVLNDATGMFFAHTQNNLIINNNIVDNESQGGLSSCGIWFWDASNNTIYHNNIMNNLLYGTQASDGDWGGTPYIPNSFNVWDDGYPSGGNYWSDYLTRYPNAKQIGSSGVGDTPYVIDANNTDRYPLMEPFNTTFGALQATSPRVSLVSPLNQTYYDSDVSLNFSVNVLSPVKSVNWTGYSLDGQQNITVAGNTTLTGLSSGLHNLTVYANDTYGNMGASQTVTFTIPEPFPTALVATASGVFAAVVCLGLLIYFKKRKNARA
jgi:parallel beta-helix repeat protein